MLPEETRSLLPDDITGGPKSAVAIIADPSRPGLVRLNCDGEQIAPKALDVIFPVMHGTYGEDGTIRDYLKWLASLTSLRRAGVELWDGQGDDEALFREADFRFQHTCFLPANGSMNGTGFQRSRSHRLSVFVKPANLVSSYISEPLTADLRVRRYLAARFDRKGCRGRTCRP